jgi:dihydroxyacetone kinase
VTRLYNDPDRFVEEMTEGFAMAHPDRVRIVPGGVVRATPSGPGRPVVVVGGGSGHYPAFAGLVGPGVADGAAMGNLFASPSRRQVHAVAVAAHAGAGILLTYGNYSGDVLNFTAAQDQLRSEGFDCRTVLVTDDVASAPADSVTFRRGIAGDLVVFKAAGAAAAAGYGLDDLARVAAKANDHTRSFGVAFAGCTLPGAPAPLFTVPPGQMDIGLGIHGEPGLARTALPAADGLADLLLDRLMTEARPDCGRVAVVLNGLGSVKYEELFVLYRAVARRLDAEGLTVVEPEVGEFCTSFDMAGVSLTLHWLDAELEQLWRAPADTPAFRKGQSDRSLNGFAQAGPPAEDITPRPGTGPAQPVDESADAVAPASQESLRAAAAVVRGLQAACATVAENAEELGRLDAVAGDGDHGVGMVRGLQAAVTAAERACALGSGAGTTLQRAGGAWADRAGGTSGALWGVLLGASGLAIGDQEPIDTAAASVAVGRAVEALQQVGGASAGDKTMLDAALPFRDALIAAIGRPLAIAWPEAAQATRIAAAGTAQLTARMGRARIHGARSIGTPDPGALSFALVVQAVAGLLEPGGDR